MEPFIADGEIHALSHDYGYILKYIKEDSCLLHDEQENFIRKYAEYLYKYDKEKVIEYIIKQILPFGLYGVRNEDFQFVFRPAQYMSVLLEKASLSLKFIRSSNDNL